MGTSGIKKEVDGWITKYRDEITDFCAKLVECKSITGHELEIQRDIILPFLKREMAWDEIDYFSVVPEGERPNINAVLKGNGEGNGLLFNSHVDVVDVPERQLPRWTKDPWKPIIEDGKLYGRGSNDMKGGITSMIWAIKALMDLNIKLKGTLAMEFVIGEEFMEHQFGTTAATKKLLRKGHTFQFCIDPEPTNCEIHNVSAGTFDFEIIISGKEVHTAMRNLVLYPQRWGIPSGESVGVDAVAKLVDILKLFEKLEKQWVHRWKHPILGSGGYPTHEDSQGVGCFTINPSFIEGGTYIASVPGYAKAHCQCYHPAWVKYEDVVADIKKVIDAYVSVDDWLRKNPPKFTAGKVFVWPPYETDANHPGCQALAKAWQEAVGKPAQLSGFKAVDDVTFIQALGIPGVSLGPGDLSMGAHGLDEHVPINHIVNCTKAFAYFIIDWCGIK